DVCCADVSSQSDSEPTYLTEPMLRGRQEQSEQQQIRRPGSAVDPQQAFEQHMQWVGSQVMNVGGCMNQKAMQVAAGLKLTDRGAQQRGQPQIGQRRGPHEPPRRSQPAP